MHGRVLTWDGPLVDPCVMHRCVHIHAVYHGYSLVVKMCEPHANGAQHTILLKTTFPTLPLPSVKVTDPFQNCEATFFSRQKDHGGRF